MNLAAEMAKLPEPRQAQWPDWDYFRHSLWVTAQREDPRTFGSWMTVHHNFLSSWLKIAPAWDFVSKDLARYDKAIRHAPYEPDDKYGEYSWNLMKLTGWLAFWEQATGRRVEDLDTIYEFGGGFGAMCYIVRKLGFTGRYALYDYPEMQLLQRWYLESEGLTADFVREPEPSDLFIATTSYSETTEDFRASFPLQADSYLIEWQARWPGVDNVRWFGEFFQTSGLTWEHVKEEQEHLTVSAGWK